ncbi:MAG: hypothetical protein JWM34_3772 [Ilumatobacteraceae bacterium]|nr:hypothetical protein [Ilumatobacteraceae bacterium]
MSNSETVLNTATGREHATVWLDVVAATDYLTLHHRPGFTVWDAVEEATRWWAADFLSPPSESESVAVPDLPWHDPDPLRSSIERLLATVGASGLPDGHGLPDVLSAALRVWLDYMSNTYNDGHRFAHPLPRAGWPTVTVSDLSP